VSPQTVPAPEPLRFGDNFELDPQTYELRRLDRRLKLERIPTELLVLLVEQRGQLVTREQIIERVWGNDVFLDTDNSINAAIRKIRYALKDDPDQPRFVQTVTGRGYRFIAPVREAAAAPAPKNVSPPSPLPAEVAVAHGADVSRNAGPPPPSSSLRIRLGLGAAFALLILAFGAYLQSRSRAHLPPPQGRLMLAVLPFENLTGDAGQDYLSDGMTEEMITQLGNLDPSRLGVIARTSVMHYQHSHAPLEQIGRELGVQYVLEGSLRRDAGNVRITAQLILMKDQSHVWARQYDRELKGLLTLQGEIAQEIADEIQLTLGAPLKLNTAYRTVSPSTASYEAYDLYLKGRYFWNKRTFEGFQRAAEYFQQAIAKDPNYASAYAGLADTFSLISVWDWGPPTELMPKARNAAVKALELDENLAEAHTSLALIAEDYDYDWQTAEKEFRRAIQLDPGYATAHQWYAESLSRQGRFEEALAESERARQLDPLSLIIATDHAAVLFYARQYDRAIAQFRAVLDMDPHFSRATMIIGAYVEEGRFAEALEEVKRGLPPDDSPRTLATKVYVYGRRGQTAQAEHELAKLKRMARYRDSDLLMAYLGTGRKDQAIAVLQKAYVEHNTFLDLKVHPAYAPLRSDPRFHDLLRHVGLEQ
jgi:TolB-like protein/DNA-binding winged helix-turn-helix (wHTH) protein/Tfp pilus assembly protein PilF